MPPVFAGAASQSTEHDLQQLLVETRRQMATVAGYAEAATKELATLRQRLADSERLQQQQAEKIQTLSQRLQGLDRSTPDVQLQWRQALFQELQRLMPHSPIAQVGDQRLVIPTDPVFVFGTGELGEEGRDRLKPIAQALVTALNVLPPDLDWRLEVAGHTDRRPLRGNGRFPSNWELSAARAVAMLRYLHEQGLAGPRLVAAGYGATAPRDPAITKAAHRLNRRVEVRLVFP